MKKIRRPKGITSDRLWPKLGTCIAQGISNTYYGGNRGWSKASTGVATSVSNYDVNPFVRKNVNRGFTYNPDEDEELHGNKVN